MRKGEEQRGEQVYFLTIYFSIYCIECRITTRGGIRGLPYTSFASPRRLHSRAKGRLVSTSVMFTVQATLDMFPACRYPTVTAAQTQG